MLVTLLWSEIFTGGVSVWQTGCYGRAGRRVAHCVQQLTSLVGSAAVWVAHISTVGELRDGIFFARRVPRACERRTCELGLGTALAVVGDREIGIHAPRVVEKAVVVVRLSIRAAHWRLGTGTHGRHTHHATGPLRRLLVGHGRAVDHCALAIADLRHVRVLAVRKLEKTRIRVGHAVGAAHWGIVAPAKCVATRAGRLLRRQHHRAVGWWLGCLT
jgi:hypothetical protein